jgi:hypothetical protein
MGMYIFSSAQAAVPEVTQRLCIEPDLTGSYTLVAFHETPPRDESDWMKNYPNQYLIFEASHAYEFVASRHKILTQDELDKAIRASSSEGMHVFTRKYSLDNTGLLNLYLEEKLDYSYRCMIVFKASGTNQVGDLLLTGYSKHATMLKKAFRRWP